MSRCGCCSTKCLLLFIFLISAIPISFLVSLELSLTPTNSYLFRSNSAWFHECAKWDPLHRRFLLSSFAGGISELSDSHRVSTVSRVSNTADMAKNASLGIAVDAPRNRLLVVVADVTGFRFSGLAAYDLSTWQRLFFTHLSTFSDEKAFADDVAVDAEGNAYVTDSKNGKIWIVGPDGKLLSTIGNPLFTPKEWYKTMVGLNGIVYHPDGFLLVVHTFSGNLLKVDLTKGKEVVKLVKVIRGSLLFGDGLELLSPKKLVVAGMPAIRLVESSDGWETASVVGSFRGPIHRIPSAATVKDGKVYVNYLVGIGFPMKHALVEAVF